jgi:hypothetical protein
MVAGAGALCPRHTQPPDRNVAATFWDTLMDYQRFHAQDFRALLKPREAMTIAVRVQLSPSVVDTQIVAATPRAAALFGYPDPAALEGQFTSMVHLLEDIQRTRLRATLRALGHAITTDQYEIRLHHPSGVVKRVIKHVEQRRVGETIVWVCSHEPADERQPFQPPAIPATVPEEALHELFGWACVAEVEAMLQQQRLLLTSLQCMDTFNQILVTRRPRVAMVPPATAMGTVERLVLQSPRPYYRCHCLVCERDWIASGADGADPEAFVPPTRCNYPDCRSTVWQDPVAAPVARRQRAARRARHPRPPSA